MNKTHPLGLRPSKIIAVHLSYASRAAERGKHPEVLSYFIKTPNSLNFSGGDLIRPEGCELFSYEGEIALIIGTPTYKISPEVAWEAVRWVTAANDAGVYDLRAVDNGSNLRSKSQDGFTPIGPELISARGIDPDQIGVWTWVNKKLVQQASGDDRLFTFSEMIADLSRTMTLLPGDIILTGTPAGAGLIKPGDVVEVAVGVGKPGAKLKNQLKVGPRLAEFGAQPDNAAPDAGKYAADLTELRINSGMNSAQNTHATGLTAATVSALNQVSTATLSSQLRKRGLNEVFLTGLVAANPTKRLLGRARTLRYLPFREDVFTAIGDGMNAQKRAVESLTPGDVLVISARGELGAGTIGDILASRAEFLGATGIITDGCLRDSPVFNELDIPTYSAGAHAAVLGRKHVPIDTDLPVSCAGVLINPGDFLVGDAEGVLVIPPELVDEIAAASLKQEKEEAWILLQVKNGAEINGLYPLGPIARKQYESEGNQ